MGYDMVRQLYYSAYDMETYISESSWPKLMQQIWPEYMPIALYVDDNHPCSLTPIFSDQYPAAYYSFKWAEVNTPLFITHYSQIITRRLDDLGVLH